MPFDIQCAFMVSGCLGWAARFIKLLWTMTMSMFEGLVCSGSPVQSLLLEGC